VVDAGVVDAGVLDAGVVDAGFVEGQDSGGDGFSDGRDDESLNPCGPDPSTGACIEFGDGGNPDAGI